MSEKDAVLLIDPTAKPHLWGGVPYGCGYWIHGKGWETTVTYSIERAWHLAFLQLAETAVSQ